jgi:hypothetical protein
LVIRNLLPARIPTAQRLGNGNNLIARLTLLFNTGLVVARPVSGFPLKQLGFCVVDTDGRPPFISQQIL